MPNVIEMSGRGYHLVWYIDQIAAALGWMVEAVSVFFAQTVQMLLTDSGAKGYQADISYAHRIAGLTRILAPIIPPPTPMLAIGLSTRAVWTYSKPMTPFPPRDNAVLSTRYFLR